MSDLDTFVSSVSPDAQFIGYCILIGALMIMLGLPGRPSNWGRDHYLKEISENIAKLTKATFQRNRG